MNHKQLVELATIQLTKWRCFPICNEMKTCVNEIPDAIGWISRASILFECKASRSDFLADKNKIFRFQHPQLGVGDFRFYLTNQNVILSQNQLPIGWGAYEVINGKIQYKFGQKYSNACLIPLIGNKKYQLKMMRSFIIRNKKFI